MPESTNNKKYSKSYLIRHALGEKFRVGIDRVSNYIKRLEMENNIQMAIKIKVG